MHQRRRTPRIIFSLAMLLVSGPVWADTIEQLQKKLAGSYAKVHSLSAKTSVSQDFKMQGLAYKAQSNGRFELLRQGGIMLFRMEMESKTVQQMGKNRSEVEGTSLIIDDGKFVYNYTVNNGAKSAIRAPSTRSTDPVSMLKNVAKTYDLKVLPEDVVDGAACYVVEARIKDPTTSPMFRQVFYLRKDVSILAKMIAYDNNGRQVATNLAKDIEVDAKIDPDRFKFEAPPGVEVIEVPAARPPGP